MSWDIFSKSKIQYFLQKLKDKFVQKETGKGLSTNDYTTTDKNKVSKIDETTTSISGNPISISGLKSNQLAVNPIITLEPIQDLHGQSNPYPAGGGKNKFTYTVESIKAANTTGTWSNNVYTLNDITFTILTDSANNVIGINVNSSQGASADTNFQVAAAGSVVLTPSVEYKFNGHISPAGSASTWHMGLGVFGYVYGESDEKTASVNAGYSGNCFITVFNGAKPNNVKFYPMIRFATETDATFAPPSNISPINGYDKIEVLSCGKNLFDGTFGVGTDTTNNKYLKSDGEIATSGNWGITNYIPVKSNTQYTLSGGTESGNAPSVCWYDANYNYIGGVIYGKQYYIRPTFPVNAKYIRASVYKDNVKTFQIEEGNSATTYTTYHKATSISESLGQTVYGGTLDVRTGEFTVTHKMVDMGDLNWAFSIVTGDVNVFVESTTSDMKTTANTRPFICECYDSVVARGTNYTISRYNIYDEAARIYVNDNRYSADAAGAAALKTALAGVKMVYELATPFTIQLAPHEISLLKDYAYLSTNGTNIALDYHNGELASLADVSQLGETVNELGNKIGIIKISGIMPNNGQSTTASYPSGFNKDNTVILREEVWCDNVWSNTTGNTVGIQSALHQNGIVVVTRDASYVGLPFRIFIEKYQ